MGDQIGSVQAINAIKPTNPYVLGNHDPFPQVGLSIGAKGKLILELYLNTCQALFENG